MRSLRELRGRTKVLKVSDKILRKPPTMEVCHVIDASFLKIGPFTSYFAFFGGTL